MKASKASVVGNAQIPIVSTNYDSYNITALNEAIVKRDEIHQAPIRGKKLFREGIDTFRLIVSTIVIFVQKIASLLTIIQPKTVLFRTFHDIHEFLTNTS